VISPPRTTCLGCSLLVGARNCYKQGQMFIDSSHDWRAQMLRKQRMDPTRITQLSQEKFIAKLSDYRHDPTNPKCTTRKHCVYNEWMVGDAVEQHGYTQRLYHACIPACRVP
jgi:hypothetical protein